MTDDPDERHEDRLGRREAVAPVNGFGLPHSSRSDAVSVLTGFHSANGWSQVGSVCERHEDVRDERDREDDRERRPAGRPRRSAPTGPSQMPIQDIAKANSSSRPTPARNCGDAGVDASSRRRGRRASARPGCRRCRRRPTTVRPVSTAERAIGSDRKRSMMPLLMSSVMPMAVVAGGEGDGLGEDAGHQVLAVGVRVRVARERDRAAEHEREQQHEHDRLEDREDRELRDARDALEVAPGDDRGRPARPGGRRPAAAGGVGAARSCGLPGHARGLRLVVVASSAAWPVRRRNTSSRVGRRRPMSSMAIPASSRSRTTCDQAPARRRATGTVSRRVCSSTVASPCAIGATRTSTARGDVGRGRGRRPRSARRRPAT